MPGVHGVVRWRLVNLAQILFEDPGVSVSEQTLSRVLRARSYRKLSAAHATKPRTPSPLLKAFPDRLAEIARAVAPGAHAVLLLDQAGWHTTQKRAAPTNITLVPCRPAPLNSTPWILRQAHNEDLWQFIRDNWLGNRVFKPYVDIRDHRCHA